MSTCVECVADFLEGSRLEEEINETEGDCAECDRACCGHHGRNYAHGGWQHETCHEALDHTRADEGEY